MPLISTCFPLNPLFSFIFRKVAEVSLLCPALPLGQGAGRGGGVGVRCCQQPLWHMLQLGAQQQTIDKLNAEKRKTDNIIVNLKTEVCTHWDMPVKREAFEDGLPCAFAFPCPFSTLCILDE